MDKENAIKTIPLDRYYHLELEGMEGYWSVGLLTMGFEGDNKDELTLFTTVKIAKSKLMLGFPYMLEITQPLKFSDLTLLVNGDHNTLNEVVSKSVSIMDFPEDDDKLGSVKTLLTMAYTEGIKELLEL